MEKTILIDEKYIPFKSTGATPLRYQAQFQRSFFKDLINIVDGGLKKDAAGEFAIEVEDISNINMDTFYNIAWVFAKTADKTIPSPIDWLDTFDEFPIIEIMPELQDMIMQTLQSKKK